ncbi:glycosyltransferase family 2 protein [Capnocytophaga canis]|uniref:glycosyltransferase family 2 protein n=1 Tax=Capnocytophaga canis TaxID=1848903 RepID=UPI00370D68E8
MNESKKLLSICIPTYNRAKILDEALGHINREMKNVDIEEVEIFISDNNSPDETFEVVQKYVELGMSLKYSKNERNIGADGNFKKCIDNANGKYLWILGDDDFLKEGSLCFLLDQLRDQDFGLVHLGDKKGVELETRVYHLPQEFLRNISYTITFISGNIVASKFASEINFEKYKETSLLQVPLYLTAAKKSQKNLFIYKKLLSTGISYNTSGGFNYFEVFIINYLSIRREFLKDTPNELFYYKKEKKNLYKRNILPFMLSIKNRHNFDYKNYWKILLKYYAMEPYFYWFFLKYALVKVYTKLYKMSDK